MAGVEFPHRLSPLVKDTANVQSFTIFGFSSFNGIGWNGISAGVHPANRIRRNYQNLQKQIQPIFIALYK